MIGHIGLRTARFESSKQFFISVLAPLGVAPTVEYPGGVDFARGNAPTFWLGESSLALSSMHVAFQASSRATVEAFYTAALASTAAPAYGRITTPCVAGLSRVRLGGLCARFP